MGRDFQKYGEVFVADDLDIFTSLTGNRDIDPYHLSRLQDSIARNNLLHSQPIVVSGELQVLDGQHRLEAARNLGLSIYFIIVDDVDLTEVQIINQNTQDWKPTDFAKAYTTMGYDEYRTYLDFRAQYGFNHRDAMRLLGGYSQGGNANKRFKSGGFQVESLEQAREWGDRIVEIGQFYRGFKRRGFIPAVLTMFEHEDYDHEKFMEKLEAQSTKLVDCVNKDDYIRLLEDIYNWSMKNKLRFY